MANAKPSKPSHAPAVTPDLEDAVKSSTPIVIVVVAVLVIGLIVALVSASNKRKASEEIAKHDMVLDAVLKDRPTLDPQATPDEREAAQKAALATRITALDGVIASEAGSRTAEDAEFFKAKAIFDQKKYPEAAAAFAAFVQTYPSKPILSGWARLGHANAVAAQGKFADALPLYRQAADLTLNADSPAVVDLARYQGAVCAMEVGDADTAKAMLESIVGSMANEQLKDQATTLLNRLTILPPAKVATTNTPVATPDTIPVAPTP